MSFVSNTIFYVVVFVTVTEWVWLAKEFPASYAHANGIYAKHLNKQVNVCEIPGKAHEYGMETECDKTRHLLRDKWPSGMAMEDMVFDAVGPLAKYFFERFLVYSVTSFILLTTGLTCTWTWRGWNALYTTKPTPILGLHKKEM